MPNRRRTGHHVRATAHNPKSPIGATDCGHSTCTPLLPDARTRFNMATWQPSFATTWQRAGRGSATSRRATCCARPPHRRLRARWECTPAPRLPQIMRHRVPQVSNQLTQVSRVRRLCTQWERPPARWARLRRSARMQPNMRDCTAHANLSSRPCMPSALRSRSGR